MKGISDNSFSQPKRFWSFFNRLTNRPSIPDLVTINDAEFTSPDSKAEAFNTYFDSVFNTDTALPTDINMAPYTDSNFTEIVLSRDDVLDALRNLDPTKTPGPDLIHPKILKECAEELAPSLCALLNLSLQTGKLPLEWKWSNIVPVFKKGDKSVISNYRPISLLSLVNKLCERCVLNKLVPSLLDLLSPKQHGFVPRKSCVTQLLTVLHDLGKLLMLDMNLMFSFWTLVRPSILCLTTYCCTNYPYMALVAHFIAGFLTTVTLDLRGCS